MRSEQLTYLLEVSQCKSISEASVKLHMTPQALSIALHNLEDELGFSLLVKTNQGSSLTKAGKEFVKIAKRYLFDVAEMQARYNVKKQPKLQFQIAATFGGLNSFIPQMICSIYKAFPEAEIVLQERSYAEILEDMQNDKIEFALFDHVIIQGKAERQVAENMLFVPLFQYNLVCLVPDEFPISKLKVISIKELIKYPVILLCVQDDRRLSSLAIMEAFGQPKKLIIERDWHTSNKMVEAGLGSKIELEVPFGQEKWKSTDTFKRIPINSDVKIFCGYLMKKDCSLSEESQILIKHIQQMMY